MAIGSLTFMVINGIDLPIDIFSVIPDFEITNEHNQAPGYGTFSDQTYPLPHSDLSFLELPGH